jgi:molybdopterin-guanine dinucleotide biosynthesis protein A
MTNASTGEIRPYDAIILAGGGSRRMGGVDKPMELVGGRPMLLRVLESVADARRRIVVGPQRDVDTDVIWTSEQPPGCGPVAAISAGVQLATADVVLVLAADLPWIAAAVSPLRSALADATVALVRAALRDNYLAAAWQRAALVDALARVPLHAGAPVRALYDGLDAAVVVDSDGWSQDCDTWDDLVAARAKGARP